MNKKLKRAARDQQKLEASSALGLFLKAYLQFH